MIEEVVGWVVVGSRSRRPRVEFADDESMRVSHETICTSLFVQTKAILPGVLTKQLRTRRVRPRPERRVNPTNDTAQMAAKPSIRARPLKVLDRRQPGHRRVTCWSAATAAASWSRSSSGTAATCSCWRSKTPRAAR